MCESLQIECKGVPILILQWTKKTLLVSGILFPHPTVYHRYLMPWPPFPKSPSTSGEPKSPSEPAWQNFLFHCLIQGLPFLSYLKDFCKISPVTEGPFWWLLLQVLPSFLSTTSSALFIVWIPELDRQSHWFFRSSHWGEEGILKPALHLEGMYSNPALYLVGTHSKPALRLVGMHSMNTNKCLHMSTQ